jgi:hypothetical protein
VGCVYFSVGAMAFNYALSDIKPIMKHFLFSFGGALFFWSIAQFIWAYYNFIAHTEVPYPSLSDIFYIGYSILMGVAFWFYFDIFRVRLTRSSLRDSLIIVIGVYVTIFFVLYQPKYELTLPPLEIAANYLYPLLDATILSLAFISLRLESKEEASNTFFIVLAVLLQVVADILFSYRTANGLYWNGDVSDLFYLFSGIASIIGISQIYKSFINQLRVYKK